MYMWFIKEENHVYWGCANQVLGNLGIEYSLTM